MTDTPRRTETEEFAARLHALRTGSGRTYESLARRVGVGAATLHRYCSGRTVPMEFAPVERLARVCGCTPEDLAALHRLWLAADTARRARPGPTGAPPEGPASAPGAVGGTGPRASDGARDAGRSGAAGAPARAEAAIGASPARETATAEGAPAGARRPGEAPGTAPGAEAPPTGAGTAAGPAAGGGPATGAPVTGPSRADDAAPPHADRPEAAVPGRPGVGNTVGTSRGAAGAAPHPEAPPAGAGAVARTTPRTRRPRPATPGTAAGEDAAPGGLVAGTRARVGQGRRGWVAVAAVVAVAGLVGGLRELTAREGSGAPPRAGAAQAPAPAATPSRGARPSPAPSPSPDRSPSPSPSPAAGTDAPAARTTPSSGARPAVTGTPIAWTSDDHVWEGACGHTYVIGRGPAAVPPPPTQADAASWAAALGALHGGGTLVRVTVQGTGGQPVVLESMQVRVVERRTPRKLPAYRMSSGCGGSLTPRLFEVDLDRARPVARPVPGSDSGVPIPAVSFPYTVSPSDPEALLVSGRSLDCDCDWVLDVAWSGGGRSGTVRIDDGGRPFRTTGVRGDALYDYDYTRGAWVDAGAEGQAEAGTASAPGASATGTTTTSGVEPTEP